MALSWRQASVTHPKARDDYEWSAGDIAFLRSHREFNRHDFTTFIRSKQLERGATSHPVIILTRRSTTATHVLVTPVSAYSSGPDNGYRPPWTQRRHRSKARHDFRAFCGSVRPQNERAHLFLEAGSMPKPETSWVYIQSVYLVPVSTLRIFDKPQNGGVLRVRDDSLADLRAHILQGNPRAMTLLNDPRLWLELPTSNADTSATNSEEVSVSSSVSLRQETWGFLNNNNDITEELPQLTPLSPSATTLTSYSGTSTITGISSLATALTSVSLNDASGTKESGTQLPAAQVKSSSQLEISAPKPATYKDVLKGSSSHALSQPPPIKTRAPKLALCRTTPTNA